MIQASRTGLLKLFAAAATVLGLSACGGGLDELAGASPGSGGTGINPGSGGTGVYASVGPIKGFGSVVVNEVKLDTSSATFQLEDISAADFGMMARITGSLNATETTGTASALQISAEIQGHIEQIQAGAGNFSLMGTTVQTQSSTIWIGVTDLSQLNNADPIRVHGYPGQGLLLATRVEKLSAAPSVFKLTGPVHSLNAASQTFQLGTQTIAFNLASLSGFGTRSVAEGMPVSVSSPVAPSTGTWSVNRVHLWWDQALPLGGNAHLSGLVTDFVDASQFKVLGIPIDASGRGVQFSADPSNLAAGTAIQVKGRWNGSVLVAQRVTFLSGAAGQAVLYSSQGSIGAFRSASDYRVRGMPVANTPSAAYVNGSASDLANGRAVLVEGIGFTSGVLQVSTVTFVP